MIKKTLSNLTCALPILCLSACGLGGTSESSTQVAARQIPTPPGAQVAGLASVILYTEQQTTNQLDALADQPAASTSVYTLYVPQGDSAYNLSTLECGITSGFNTAYLFFDIHEGDYIPYIVAEANDNGQRTVCIGTVAGNDYSQYTYSKVEFGNYQSTVNHSIESMPQYIHAHNELDNSVLATGVTVESGGLVYNVVGGDASTIAVAPNFKTGCVDTGSKTATFVNALDAATMPRGQYEDRNYIAVGTNTGDICVYDTESKGWTNLTNRSKVALQGYSFGSSVEGIAFASISSHNYGYWVSANGTLWRVVADINNNPETFNQLNGSGLSGAPAVAPGYITAIFADENNNLYIGTLDGHVYVYGAGSGAWGSTELTMADGTVDQTAVMRINYTVDGTAVHAQTSAGNIYNVSISTF